MASVTKQAALVVVDQSTEGTIAPAIGALGGTVAETDGLLFGALGEGISDSGLSYETERERLEVGRAGAGATQSPSAFVEEKFTNFTFAWRAGGPLQDIGGTATDSDFTWPHANVGLDSLFKAAGLHADTTGTINATATRYVPSSTGTLFASARIYDSGIHYDVRDIKVNSLTWTFTPGEFPIVTAELFGVFDDHNALAFPTLTYGDMHNVPTLPVWETSMDWGGNAIKFESFEVGMSNNVDFLEHSNFRSTVAAGLDVTYSIKCYADDGYNTYFADRLRAAYSASDDLDFTIGSGTAINENAKSCVLSLTVPEVQSLEPDVIGSKAAWSISGEARRPDNVEIIAWENF